MQAKPGRSQPTKALTSNALLLAAVLAAQSALVGAAYVLKGPERVRPKADVVVVFDTTGSMNPYIERMQANAIRFAHAVEGEAVDCHLGLVGYGDVPAGEEITVFGLTEDPSAFRAQVRELPRTDGGDEPESALEALEEAITMRHRPDARRVFILITDADFHEPDIHGHGAENILSKLKALDAPLYIVGPTKRLHRGLRYADMSACTHGRFHSIHASGDFSDVILDIARRINASLVR